MATEMHLSLTKRTSPTLTNVPSGWLDFTWTPWTRHDRRAWVTCAPGGVQAVGPRCWVGFEGYVRVSVLLFVGYGKVARREGIVADDVMHEQDMYYCREV
jgi:hypothetical protein